MTVQAPQFPVAQPMWTPVRRSSSLSISARIIRVSISSWRGSPFTVTRIGTLTPCTLLACCRPSPTQLDQSAADRPPSEHPCHGPPVFGVGMEVGRRSLTGLDRRLVNGSERVLGRLVPQEWSTVDRDGVGAYSADRHPSPLEAERHDRRRVDDGEAPLHSG